MRWYHVVRASALAGIVAAIADPGCPRPRRTTIDLAFTSAVGPDARARLQGTLTSHATAWAEVRPGGRGGDLRVIAGPATPVLAEIARRPAALALRPVEPVLEIADLGVAPRVATGTSTPVSVAVASVPAGAGRLVCWIEDVRTRREQARHEETIHGSPGRDAIRVTMPWLAVQDGNRHLRVHAAWTGADQRVVHASPADVVVRVMPVPVRVDVLEARPTWSARFARLALEQSAAITVQTRVRVAPGVDVRTRASGDDDEPGGGEATAATVLLVGGLEALSPSDVTRLAREARDRGRAVILLADDLPGGGPWRELWPKALGRLRRASAARPARVAGHRWMVREWLVPDTSSTLVRPLAYLEDSPRAPIVIARALGAGRVVLVTAVDAWRWRGTPGTGYAQGWQALVQRLAADVPAPVAVTSWVSGTGADRGVHLDVDVRPDLRLAATEVTATLTAGASTLAVPLWPAGPGRLRGALPPITATGLHQAQVDVRQGARVVGRGHGVIDVGPTAQPAVWADVERIQAQSGAVAAAEQDLAATLATLRRGVRPPADVRRWPTRSWWFAALVIGALGIEWMARRLARER